MSKGKFSLTSLLNAKSKGSIENTPPRAGEQFKIVYISVYKLRPSKDNFYNVNDVDDLKDSIEMTGGIKQNLEVVPIPDTDEYEVIAGHRRRLASIKLVEEGKGQYEFVPCRIEKELSEIEKKLLLILTNSTTRHLTEWEKAEQIAKLKELLREYKKTHDIPGRIRELLADSLDMSSSQVARYESINENLMPELKEEFKQNNINFSAAAELSRMPLADQKAVYEQHKETGQTNLKTVRQKKAETVHREEQPAPASIPELAPEPPKIRLTELQDLLNSLVRIRAQYDSLMDNQTGEKALKSLEELNASLYDDIEAIKTSVLGEPLFCENGGGE